MEVRAGVGDHAANGVGVAGQDHVGGRSGVVEIRRALALGGPGQQGEFLHAGNLFQLVQGQAGLSEGHAVHEIVVIVAVLTVAAAVAAHVVDVAHEGGQSQD